MKKVKSSRAAGRKGRKPWVSPEELKRAVLRGGKPHRKRQVTTITIDPEILKKAQEHGLNISRTSEFALKEAIDRLEREENAWVKFRRMLEKLVGLLRRGPRERYVKF